MKRKRKLIIIIFAVIFLILCVLLIKYSEILVSDNYINDKEISEKEISENEISENEISEKEISEKEISENEIIENIHVSPWETPIEIKSSPDNKDFNYNINNKIPLEIQNLVRANREPLFKSPQMLQNEMDDLFKENYIEEDDIAFRDFYLEEENKDHQPILELTIEQALEDVKYFFGLLKYYYGGYSYYGGDEVFNKIESTITKEINESGELITNTELEDLLVTNLINIIDDCHFAIGNTAFYKIHQKNNFLFCNDLFFMKTDFGFTTKINEINYTLHSINDEEVENKMFPFLNENAEVVWVIGILSNKLDLAQIKITLIDENTGELTEKVIKFTNPPTYEQGQPGSYSLKYLDKIPVLSVFSMMKIDSFEGKEAEEVKDVARTLRDEPVFIIDLRGNLGGKAYFSDIWIKEYAQLDTYPSVGIIGSSRNTETVRMILNSNDELPASTWSPISVVENKKIPNNNIIFVVIDQNVASASEYMVQLLRQMENVIFMGTNTAGINLIGNNEEFSLPNSRIRLYLGRNINLNLDLSTDEGIGFLPDIWTTNISRTVKFIKKYKLDE